MKVIGFTCLHYGVDYLEWAIRSVIDHIDEHWCIYSPVGSHGHRTTLPCPDTRDELYAAAQRGAGNKLRWVEGTWPYEGAHREHIHKVAPDADVILVVDADEVWSTDYALLVSDPLLTPLMQKRRLRLPMIHYWRSFYRAILHDPALPVRVLYPKAPDGEVTIPEFVPHGHWHGINHMGYAQRPEIVEYKQHTHGHKGEWRKDIDWFQERFMANAQTDCHPVGSEWWNPEFVHPLDYMPSWMQEHPYFNKAVIE